jgi:hypothetical protein
MTWCNDWFIRVVGKRNRHPLGTKRGKVFFLGFYLVGIVIARLDYFIINTLKNIYIINIGGGKFSQVPVLLVVCFEAYLYS